MARARTSKKASPAPTGPSHEQIVAIADSVRRDGCVARAGLTRLGIRKVDVPSAVEQLAGMGLEVTSKFVRVPLVEQLATRLADAGALAIRGAHDAFAGASKKEVAACIDELVSAGRAHRVVRSTEVVVVEKEGGTIDRPDLDALERATEGLVKTLKLARKEKATLLYADLERTLGRFMTSSTKARVAGTRGATVADLADVVDAQREKSGLTFVPGVVRALGGAASREAVHAALVQGANSGLYELRPESGLGRLSQEDLNLCVPGPQGSRLSWVRRIEERS